MTNARNDHNQGTPTPTDQGTRAWRLCAIGQTGMFGIRATVATNSYDTRSEGPDAPGGSVNEGRQQDAERASRDSGIYIDSGAFLPVDGSGGT